MAGHELTTDQADYLETLATIVDRYEAEHGPPTAPDATGRELLGAVMAEHELTTERVAEILGADRSLVSHVLAGRRGLTWDHAKALGHRFALSPAAFME